MQKYSPFSILTTLLLKKIVHSCHAGRWLAVILLLLGQLGTARAAGFFWNTEPPRPSPALRRADSLFAKAQYAAALPLYRAQVWQRQQVSGLLLLRLAYAERQLGHPPAEILYLNMALARQPRLDTWQRLVMLAQRQHLVGYPATWQQELRVGLWHYYYPVLQGLLSGAVLAAVLLLLRRRRAHRPAWLAYGAYLLLVAAYLYALRPAPTGIVTRAGAALMAGPSAGAGWLSTAAPGDRLPVLGRHDIWLEVSWQERTAYVRATDALVVE